MKKLLCLGVIGSILLTGCGGSSDTAKKEETKEEKKEEKKTEFQIGETAEVEGTKITVNSVREDYGNDFMKPAEGKVYYILDVSLENTKDKEFASSSLLCYELKDGDGRKQDISIFADLNGSLDTTVPANDKAAGEIAFEANAEGPLVLTFTPQIKGSVKIVVR